MIRLFFILSLLCWSTQEGQGQEGGVLQCGPGNMMLTNSDQMLLLSWEDEPSCSVPDGVLTCELVVLITDKQVHYHEFQMTPDMIGSPHSWNWTSYLALECATHIVKLRYRNQSHTSVWVQEQILLGNQNSDRKRVFPRDRVFEVGSKATFCCVLKVDESFASMSVNSKKGSFKMNSTKFSDFLYAMTLYLNHSLDVKCDTSKTSYGTCVYVGYPPGDKDLQCETRNLESVECHWTVGRDTNISLKSPTIYQLLGRSCVNEEKGRCSQKIQVDAGERNLILTAKNKLGMVELHDNADLTKRVYMFAPETVRAPTVKARSIHLEWTWPVQQYNDINISCQAHIIHGEASKIRENAGIGLNVFILNDLKPNWKYSVQIRCATAQHFWKWGDWSKALYFHTKTDVPDSLDVWMRMEETQAVVLWKKLLTNQSHGDIIDYEVSWTEIGGRDKGNRTTVAANNTSLTLDLDTSKQHVVTVTARNINGSSYPSSITIPSLSVEKAGVSSSWIPVNNRSFILTLPACPMASCGFIVDWCPTLGNCNLEWLKVPPNKTNITISSKHFKDGRRYSLSVYACTQGAPVLLQRREGYVRETRIKNSIFQNLTAKQQNSNLEVSWEPINLTKQTAAILGYNLYYQEANNSVLIASSGDPAATSLMVRNLNVSSYNFTMAVVTRLGVCGNSSFIFPFRSQTNNLVIGVFLSLGGIFALLSLTSVICFRHWACIRQKVYPPIPKPALTDKWLTSTGQPGCQNLHSECDVLHTLHLQYNSEAAVTTSIYEEDTYVSLKQNLNKSISQHLPGSGLPPSLCRDFNNLSYDLILEKGAQQCHSKDEEGILSARDSSGYQPQKSSEALHQTLEDPDSPMSCLSNYILLPSST